MPPELPTREMFEPRRREARRCYAYPSWDGGPRGLPGPPARAPSAARAPSPTPRRGGRTLDVPPSEGAGIAGEILRTTATPPPAPLLALPPRCPPAAPPGSPPRRGR